MLLFVFAIFAQILNQSPPVDIPQPPQDALIPAQAYITDDPINPDRFGLAVPTGRYMIEPIHGWCIGELRSGMNVTLQGWVSDTPPMPEGAPIALDGFGVYSLGLVFPDDPGEGCLVYIHRLMDATPCFTDDSGLCDVAQEFD